MSGRPLRRLCGIGISALLAVVLTSVGTLAEAGVLQYHGGPIISSMEIVPQYVGEKSSFWSVKIAEHQTYLDFLADFISGRGKPAATQTVLQQYGLRAATIAPATFDRSGTPGPITRAQALNLIKNAQTRGTVAPFAPNRLILLVLASGYSISDGPCAFHSNDGPGRIYAVVSASCEQWLSVTGRHVLGAALSAEGTGWDDPVDGCPQSNVLSGEIPAVWDNRLGGVCSMSGYDLIQTPITAGPVTGYVRYDNTSTVIYRNGSNRLRELTLTPGGWSRGDLLDASGGVAPAGDASAYIRAGKTSVVYRTFSNTIEELRLSGWSWDHRNISPPSLNPNVAGDPIGYVRADGVSTVVYRRQDGHLIELALYGQSSTTDGAWRLGDLTSAGGALGAASDPAVFLRSDGASSVVFRSADNHIRELQLVNGGWSTRDWTPNPTGAALTGKPAPYVRSDGANVVIVRDTDGQLYELSFSYNVPQKTPLSAPIGARVAISDPYPYVRSDGFNAIVYQGSDNHIWEIGRWSGTTGWSCGDLSWISGSPDAVSKPSGYVRSDGTNVVVFKGADLHIREIRWEGGSWLPGDLGS